MNRSGLACASVLLAAAWVFLASQSASDAAPPPDTMQYQGRLTDSNGKPLEGTVATLRFQLFTQSTASSAAFVWGEVHQNVPVSRGVFTVLLGAGDQKIDSFGGTPTAGPHPLVSGDFGGNASRYLEIKVDSFPALAPLTQLGAVPFALAAGGSVPVGGIIDWLRPDPSSPLPDGWVICDGSPINDPESPLVGLNAPNLVNKFVRGGGVGLLATGYGYGAGTDPAPKISDFGGAESHGLQHVHPMAHDHGRIQGTTGDRDAAGLTLHGFQGGIIAHTHKINLAPQPSAVANTGSSTAGGSFDNKPPFVGLIKLMRIK